MRRRAVRSVRGIRAGFVLKVGGALCLTIAVTLTSGCGDSSAEREDSAPSTTKTPPPPTTTTTLATRTEIWAPEPPDAIVLNMDGFEFDQTALRISGGTLKVAMRNLEEPCPRPIDCPPANFAHFFVILDPKRGVPLVRSEQIFPGQTGVFVVEGLKPGSYRFICSRHAKNGMMGTLEVT